MLCHAKGADPSACLARPCVPSVAAEGRNGESSFFWGGGLGVSAAATTDSHTLKPGEAGEAEREHLCREGVAAENVITRVTADAFVPGASSGALGGRGRGLVRHVAAALNNTHYQPDAHGDCS